MRVGRLQCQDKGNSYMHTFRTYTLYLRIIKYVCTKKCTISVCINPLNANDADRRHRIRKRVSANDAFRRHRLARAIRVVFLYLRASERNVTLRAPVGVVGPSHSYLIVSSGRTRGAQSSAALCAKFHAVLLD